MLPVIPLYVKIIMTVALSAIAVFLFLRLGGQSRRLCMIAMLLSTVGDFFMTDVFGIGSFSTYPGAAFFMAAHVVYGGCFAKALKEKGGRYFGCGFWTGLVFMVPTAAGLGIAAFTIPEKPQTVMFLLILLYIAVIGYNLCSNFAFSFAEKGQYLVLPFAIILFYATDIFIFLEMLNVTDAMRYYVWYGYPLAQLALILFNSPLKKRSASDRMPHMF